uniref:GLTSCR1 domain-containing protein n=1 Tax=Strongyloides venezuelensis TaxID=75913 RepID=A0A0K0EVK4_STRVS
MSNQRFRSNEANNAHTSDGFEDELILWEINEVLGCNSPPPDNKNQPINVSRNQNPGGHNIATNNSIVQQNRHLQNGQNDNFASHHGNHNQHKTNLNLQQQNHQYKNQMLQQVLQNKTYRSTQPGNEELKKIMKGNTSQNIQQIQQQQITSSPQSSQQNLLRDCQVQHTNVDQPHILSNQPQQHIIVQQISSPLQQGTIAVQLGSSSNQQIIGTNFPPESLRPVSQMLTSKNILPTTSNRNISSNDQNYISPINSINNQITSSSIGGNNRQSGQQQQLSNMLNTQQQQIPQQRQNPSHSVPKNQQSNSNVFEKRSMPYQQVQSSLSRPQSQSQIVNSPASVSTPQSNQKYVESPTYSNSPSNSQSNPSPKIQQRQNVNGQFLVQSQLQHLTSQGSNTVVVLPSNGQNIARYNEDARVVTQSQFISPQTRTVGAAIIQQNNLQQTRFIPQFQNANILTTTSNGDLRQEIFQTGNINAKSQPIIIEQGGSRILQHVVLETPQQINQNIRTSSVPTTISIQSQPITHVTSIQQPSVQSVTIHGQKHVTQQQQLQSQIGQNYVNTSKPQSQQHIQANKPHQSNINNIQQPGGNKKNTKPTTTANRTIPKKKTIHTPTTTPNTSFNNSMNNSSSKLQTTPTTSTQQTPSVTNDNSLQANQMAVRLSLENLHQISRISEEIEKLRQLQIKTGQNQSAKIKSLEDKRGLIFISALQQQHNVTTQIQTPISKTTPLSQPKPLPNTSKNKGQNKRNQKVTTTTTGIQGESGTPKMVPSTIMSNVNKHNTSSNRTPSSIKDNKNINRTMDKKSLQHSGITDMNDSQSTSSQQVYDTSKSDDLPIDKLKTENCELSKDSNRPKSIDADGDENSKDSCKSPEEPKIVIPTPTAQASRIASQIEYRKRHIENFKAEMLRIVNNPDVSTPFQSKSDVVRRLIPYSIFQEPELKPETLERFDHDYLRLRNSQLCRIKNLEDKLRGKMMKEAETPTQFKADHIQFLMMDVEYEKRRLRREKEKANTDEVEDVIDKSFADNGNNINLFSDLKNYIQKKQESIPLPHKLHFSYDLPEVDPSKFIPNIPDTWKSPYTTVYDSSDEELEEIEESESSSEESEEDFNSPVSCSEKESIENMQQESSLIFIKSTGQSINPLTSSNVPKCNTTIQVEQSITKIGSNNILTEKITKNDQTSIAAMLQKLEGLDNSENNIITTTSSNDIKEENHYQKLSIRLSKSNIINGDILATNTKCAKNNSSFSTELLLNNMDNSIPEKSSHSNTSKFTPTPEVSSVISFSQCLENVSTCSSVISEGEKVNPKCILKIPKINNEFKIDVNELNDDKDKRKQKKRDRKERKKAKKLEKQRLMELNASETQNSFESLSPTPRLVLKLNRNTSFKETAQEKIDDKSVMVNDDKMIKKVVSPIKIDKKYKDEGYKSVINSFKKPKSIENNDVKNVNLSFNENILRGTKEEVINKYEAKKRKSDGPSIIPLKIPKLKLPKLPVSDVVSNEPSIHKTTSQLSIPKLKIPISSIPCSEGKIQKLSISKKSLSTLPGSSSDVTGSFNTLTDDNIYTSHETVSTSDNPKKDKKSKEHRKDKDKSNRKDKKHKKKHEEDERIVAPIKLSLKNSLEPCQNSSFNAIKSTEKSKIILNLNKTWNNEESTFSVVDDRRKFQSTFSKSSTSTDSIKVKNSDLILKLPKIKKETTTIKQDSNIDDMCVEKIKPLKLSLKSLKEKQTDNHDIPPLKIKKKSNVDKDTKEHKKMKDKKKGHNSYPVRPLHGTNPVLPPQERLASAYAEVERRSMIGKAPTLMNFS